MVEVVFDYQQRKTVIQGNLDDLLENIIKKYVQKSNLDINNTMEKLLIKKTSLKT